MTGANISSTQWNQTGSAPRARLGCLKTARRRGCPAALLQPLCLSRAPHQTMAVKHLSMRAGLHPLKSAFFSYPAFCLTRTHSQRCIALRCRHGGWCSRQKTASQ